jgi:hypothetical protein
MGTRAQLGVLTAGWTDADPAVIRSTATRVLAAAHTLADALTEDEAAEQPAA